MDQASASAFGTAAYESLYSQHPGECITTAGTFGAAIVYAERNRIGQMGGWLVVQTATAMVPKSAMPAAPAIGSRVTAGGRTMRVERVGGQNDCDPSWRLYLVEAN